MPPTEIVVPGDGDSEDDGVGDEDDCVGVGDDEDCVGVGDEDDWVGVGDGVGRASCTNVSAASSMAAARESLTSPAERSLSTSAFS